MFRKLHAPSRTVTILVDERPLDAEPGDSVAGALLAAGYTVFRNSPRSRAPRAPLCMIGNCFECLCAIDGVRDRQACLTPVSDGLRVSLEPLRRE
jgi:hypothetical protein